MTQVPNVVHSIDSVQAENHKLQGNEFYKQRDYPNAIKYYNKAIQSNPNNVSYLNNRAAANLMLNKFEEAYTDCQRCLSLEPDNTKTLSRAAKCCLSLGNLMDAEDYSKQLLQIDPRNSDVTSLKHDIDSLRSNYDAYQAKLKANDLAHALFLINKCIEISHASLNFKLEKVDILIRLKRIVEAKAFVESLISSSGNNVSLDILFYRGILLYYMNNSGKAFEHFSHILQQNPDHSKTQKFYKLAKQILKLKEEGNDLIKKKNFKAAYDSYTKAIELDPLNIGLNAILHCNRACALYNLGQYENAISDCDMSLALDPNYSKAFIRKATCYDALEKYEEAINEWEKLINIDTNPEHQKGLKEAKRALERSKQVNFYKVLGVAKTASDDEIKKAYKKRALLHHPDRHSHADDNTKLEEEKKFKEVGEAYAVLSDPAKRKRYDNGQYFNGDSECCASNVNAAEMFAQMFANGQSRCTTTAGPGQTFHFSF